MSGQNCGKNDNKVYTFSASQIDDLSSNYKHFDGDLPNSVYEDGIIYYSIDPALADYKGLIQTELQQIGSLGGVAFLEADSATTPELVFEKYLGATGKNDLSGVLAQFIPGTNKIQLNLELLNQISQKVPPELINDALKSVFPHELMHAIGLAHIEDGGSKILTRLGTLFQSSDVSNKDPDGLKNEQTGNFDFYHPTAIGPVDMSMLSRELGYQPTWLEQHWSGKVATKKPLDYISYYNQTNNLQWPIQNANGGLTISLGDWAIDKEIAIIEMPNDGVSNKGNIAIMSSTGFVVIPEVLGKSQNITIEIHDKDGSVISSGPITPTSGQIDLSTLSVAMQGAMNGMSPQQTKVAEERTQDGNYNTLKPYCNIAGLEDADHPTSPQSPSIVDFFKNLKWRSWP